ncbi:MAG: hypothetical protein XU09_C0006G0044 [Thaumarchaeota archaeon CSP1-1]|nr:MAG: hypothetical protein XU09_C0006G0044 [Thaumarchaeota archaeon CSP1-1]
MHKKKFLYIGISVAVLALAVSLSFSLFNNDAELITESLPELKFTYIESNAKLKESLASHGISMSSPVKLSTIKDIEKFCSFFADKNKQDQVDYCTSTELRDSDGEFLGNIHMVGSRNMPKIVLVLIQTDPFMQDLDEIKSVYDVVIENLVCNCWEDVKPSEIETVSDWVDRQKDFHTSDVKPTSKSNLSIMGMSLQMELTTNTEGYLWKLLISG